MDNLRILLVEDDEAFAQYVVLLLQEAAEAYRLSHEPCFDKALDRIGSEEFDVLLLDLNLPGTSGLPTLHSVQAVLRDRCPVVVLSGMGDQQFHMEALRQGAQDFLIKSDLNGNELVRAVSYATERHQMRSRMSQALREAEQAKHSFEDLIVKNVDGVLVLDREGVVLYCNPAAETLLGRRAEDLMGLELGIPSFSGETTEVDIVDTQGKQRLSEMRVVDTEWMGRPVYIASLRDVTGRRQAEMEREKLQSRVGSVLARLQESFRLLAEGHLDTRVGTDLPGELREGPFSEVLLHFDETVEKLEGLTRLNAEIYTMSTHDLRLPLSTMLLSLDHHMNNLQASPDQRRDWLKVCQRSGAKLLRRLDRLMHLFAIESDKMDVILQPTDLGALLRHCTRDLERLALDRRQTLQLSETPPLPEVFCDPFKIVHVLENLVSNAIKYSEEEGTITLAASMADDAHVRVDVADQGAGIPAADRDGIFDRFQRGSQQRGKSHGSGLGLAICKDLIEAHGGRIWLESPNGRGTRFSFTIPVNGVSRDEGTGLAVTRQGEGVG